LACASADVLPIAATAAAIVNAANFAFISTLLQ
jgi:hypothetical protein